MDGGSHERSLDRIEGALARITAAVDKPPCDSAESTDFADLASRHEQLKQGVALSLAALDALIAGVQK